MPRRTPSGDRAAVNRLLSKMPVMRMPVMFSSPRTKTNPVFYADQLRLVLADEPDRLERVFNDPDSVDLLTWNVFASLDTHDDNAWLAHRLEALGGPQVRAPARISLWSGRHRGPLLHPSPGYLDMIRERSDKAGGPAADLSEFARPIEVPVRIETPSVLILVDTALASTPRGSGGRDRLLELIDAGTDHARRLSKQLAVAVVYASGSITAAELSTRLQQLRDRRRLAADMPYRDVPPDLLLREVSWQQLLRTWESELDYLSVDGQPVRAFLSHAKARGLY